MRFCMVTTFYPPHAFGGDGVFVWRLSNLLARHGHEVHVIHCLDSYHALRQSGPTDAWPNHPGVTVHALQSGVGVLSPLVTHVTGRPGFKARRIEALLNDGDFDVIHYHNVSLMGAPVLSMGRGIKLYTLHEHWLLCPTHVLFKFNRTPCQERACLRCTLSYRRPPQLWRHTDLLARHLPAVDCFLAPSRYTRRMHEDGGLGIPIRHLPHAIDAACHAPPTRSRAEAGLPAEPYFLFVGRLERLKGLHTVIPLFDANFPARLVVAGTGSEEAALRRLAGDSDRVVFLGAIGGERLRRAYADAVATVVPSIGFETFAMVIAESLAQRTPVVAHDLGPLPELVNESGGGLVYRDAAGLREALRRLLAEPELRTDLGERGHAWCKAEWSEGRHLQRYLALIGELAVERRPEHGLLKAGGAP